MQVEPEPLELLDELEELELLEDDEDEELLELEDVLLPDEEELLLDEPLELEELLEDDEEEELLELEELCASHLFVVRLQVSPKLPLHIVILVQKFPGCGLTTQYPVITIEFGKSP